MAYKNIEDRIRSGKEYYLKNKDKIRAKDKARSLANADNPEFIRKRREAGLRSYYKHKEKRNKYTTQNGHKYKIKSRYGITIDDYNNILLKQGNLCAICKCDPNIKGWTSKNRPLVVDHCHKTNIVRGLLCNHCNWLIGQASDNTTILLNAIDYLNFYTSVPITAKVG